MSCVSCVSVLLRVWFLVDCCMSHCETTFLSCCVYCTYFKMSTGEHRATAEKRVTIVVKSVVKAKSLATGGAKTVDVQIEVEGVAETGPSQESNNNDYKTETAIVTASATPSVTTTATTVATNKDTKTRAEKQDRKETRAEPGKSTTLFLEEENCGKPERRRGWQRQRREAALFSSHFYPSLRS